MAVGFPGDHDLTHCLRFLGIIHNGSLLHRLQRLSEHRPSIGSATPRYLLTVLCPFCDRSRHVIYSAIPSYPAKTSITIPEDIPPSFFVFSRLVLPHRTSRRQSGSCFCLETCWVRIGPAWPVPLEPRRCLGRGGWAMRPSCACLGSMACRCYFAVDINGYCPSESFINWVIV